MSFSFNIFPTYCINLWWPNITIQHLLWQGRFLILRSSSAVLPLRIFPCNFYPYLYFAVWRTWRKDLILVGPRLTLEPRPEETFGSAAFQTSTPTFPVAAPHRREAEELGASPWDVDIHQTLEKPRLPVSAQPTERWPVVLVLETGFLPPGNSAHINVPVWMATRLGMPSFIGLLFDLALAATIGSCLPVNVK